jgi:hypothetical protein
MSEMQRPLSQISELPEAISQAEVSHVENGDDELYVKTTILRTACDILWLEDTGTLWTSSDPTPYTISLDTLCHRLLYGKPAPSPIKNFLKDVALTRKLLKDGKTTRTPLLRPLEDFEDVYYVSLAVIRELHDRIRTRVNEGFTELDDIITDQNHEETGLPLTAVLAHGELRGWWSVLNSPTLVKTLDQAVVRERVKAMHSDVLRRIEDGVFSKKFGDNIIVEIYAKDEREEIEGLAWIGSWGPGLISAWLEEKYRVVFEVEQVMTKEKEEAEKKEATKKGKEKDKEIEKKGKS